MENWRKALRYDPLPALTSCGNQAVEIFARRELGGDNAVSIEQLQHHPDVRRILKKQQPDGAWPHSGENKHAVQRVDLVETWRNLRFLVEQYGMTRAHPQVQAACEFVFSCQTEAGDIRGFIGNQYATYYTGALMALLILAGYDDDERIAHGFHWLLGMRQTDGGWSVPMITHKFDRDTQYRLTTEDCPPVEPDRCKPFSHNATGMILRAFAVHPVYRKDEAAVHAAHLLKSRFFEPDAYTSYQSQEYWLRFEYPFWWNNLVSALDSISRIGLPSTDDRIQRALTWLVEHQKENGLWSHDYRHSQGEEEQTRKSYEQACWVSLAICRIFQRLLG